MLFCVTKAINLFSPHPVLTFMALAMVFLDQDEALATEAA